VKNLDGLKAKITTDFIETTRKRFNDMFLQLKNA
ncbi:MAG: hypothetical protein K0S12_2147, partial [Bacteroidetes bacterium]|nr:hypothetical protein [Bacteroidota bacterium]